MLYHVRALLRSGFLAEEPSRLGPRGTVDKPYRYRLESTMTGADVSLLRAVPGAVTAEADEAGPDTVAEGVRLALRLRPEQLADLQARMRELIGSFPGANEYLATEAELGADP